MLVFLKKGKKTTIYLFLKMICHDKFRLSILIHIHAFALCTTCMVMGYEMDFDELMCILL
jgi:uncharacterized membrane protein